MEMKWGMYMITEVEKSKRGFSDMDLAEDNSFIREIIDTGKEID
jgi:hypothetical protein